MARVAGRYRSPRGHPSNRHDAPSLAAAGRLIALSVTGGPGGPLRVAETPPMSPEPARADFFFVFLTSGTQVSLHLRRYSRMTRETFRKTRG
ncbi:hypothetical protein P3T21_001917 [Paraburkholderia sp. GAS334]